MALVDLVADHAAGDRAGRSRGLLAAAAADLVAEQAADDRAGHGDADVAVPLGQPFLDHHVLADFPGYAGLGGFAHRLGADHGGVELLLLGYRIDLDDLGVLQGVGRDLVLARGRVVGGQRRIGRGGEHRIGLPVAVVHEGRGSDAPHQQGTGGDQDRSGLLHGLAPRGRFPHDVRGDSIMANLNRTRNAFDRPILRVCDGHGSLRACSERGPPPCPAPSCCR